MADRDYYDILGVSRDATADQIKKAYRGQARKYHPDVNPGDKQAEARFKETQEAYDVLNDSEKRALYDRYGKAGFQGAGSYGPRTNAWDYRTNQGDAETINFDFSDLFGPGGAGGMTAEGEPTGSAGSIFEELIGRVRGGAGGHGARGKRGGPAAHTRHRGRAHHPVSHRRSRRQDLHRTDPRQWPHGSPRSQDPPRHRYRQQATSEGQGGARRPRLSRPAT